MKTNMSPNRWTEKNYNTIGSEKKYQSHGPKGLYIPVKCG